MFKKIGMTIFILGIGIAATFATKNTPDVNDALVVKHRAKLSKKQAEASLAMYCGAIEKSLKGDENPELKALALIDGCPEEETKQEEEAEEPAADAADAPEDPAAKAEREKAEKFKAEAKAAKTPPLPGHVGIWRQSVSPWDEAVRGEADVFLELTPTGSAVLFDVMKVGDRWVPRARGNYNVNKGAVTVNVCGVGRQVDIGCSTSVFRMAGHRLSLHNVKVSRGGSRGRSGVEFVQLERSEELTKKYNFLATSKLELDGVAAAGAGKKLPEAVSKARDEWQKKLKISAEAKGEKVGRKPPTPAGTRFNRWFGANAPGFLLGLLLLIIGGMMSRVAIRREALGEGEEESGEAVDFGELLQEVCLSVAARAEEMKSIHEPTQEDHDRVVAFIDELKLKSIERLVEGRTRLEIVYGIAGYAMVFGPFSRGERYLNRAWSALVDQHWPEASDSMAISAGSFADAKGQLDEVMSEAEAG